MHINKYDNQVSTAYESSHRAIRSFWQRFYRFIRYSLYTHTQEYEYTHIYEYIGNQYFRQWNIECGATMPV